MKYRHFRTIARVLVIFSVLAGIGTFILFIATGIAVGGATLIIYLFLGIGGGFFSFAFIYAFSQFIYIFIDIERNTRATLRALLEEVEVKEGE